MPEIGIVNYGAGNIASVLKAVDYAGADAELVSTPEQILSCERLVLPGVGASGQAIQKLKEKHLDEALYQAVRIEGKPFLGICVGMQLLAKDLYEFGHHEGLGWVNGSVISLKDHGINTLPVPHMGWNDIHFNDDDIPSSLKSLDKQLGPHRSFYFAHSYTLRLDDEEKEKMSLQVQYQENMVAGLLFDSVAAVQFHPEKSQLSGDILMQWFIDWSPS